MAVTGASDKHGPGSHEPLVLVVSGPSGAGKSTVIRRLLDIEPGMKLSVSATTRSPRPGETDGVDYHFVDEDEFGEMVESDGFLEHADVFGRLYGTPKSEVEAARDGGYDLIVEIDVQGAKQLKPKVAEAVAVFIVPQDPEELESRLRGRGTEAEEDVQRRLGIAKEEISFMETSDCYDYIVENDEVEAAAARLRSIVVAERCRKNRTGALDVWIRMTSMS